MANKHSSKPGIRPGDTLARLLGIAFLAAALVGCEQEGGGNVQNTPPPSERARNLMVAANYGGAAREYLRLADENRGPLAAGLKTAAANALLSAGDELSARKVMTGVSLADLSPSNQALADLLAARLAIIDGQGERAASLLPAQGAVPVEFQLAAAQTRVGALEMGADRLGAARARSELDLMLVEPSARAENHQRLWRILNDTNRAALAGAAIPPPDTFGGWVELAEINGLYVGDADTLRAELDRWQVRYPGHPAWFTIVPGMRTASEQLSRPADRVTLLLPLSGRFSQAGAAVREGFIAAWLNARGTGAGTQLSVVDTESVDVATAYRDAAASGTQFVVGPLRKEAIAAIVQTGALEVPMLALNAVDWPQDAQSPRPAALFQMALSPEQEAAQVAERIWYDGHVTVAMISPSGDWGDRVVEAFQSAYSDLGGQVVEHQSFDPTGRDLSAPVAQLLNIDESDERYRALRNMLGVDLKHELRRRQDIDAIFMASFANQARLLRPQLRFHRATRVPVYSTSHVYTGQPNPELDRDIDGVLFGDMPWILDANLDNDPVKRELLLHWPEAMAGYARLFALGADAAALMGQLGRLRSGTVSSYAGYTGELQVDSNNVIVRKLQWAQFNNGLAEPLDTLGLPGIAPALPSSQ
jgi:outer membrane PBP1 activator LpoA protein